jgi:hypothetical protein
MRIYQDSDYKTVCDWCFRRDKPAPPQWSLPEVGFFVDDIACGFLIATNNHCGILDFYISNPLAGKIQRYEALRSITLEIIETAQLLGMKMLLFNTQFKSIKNLGIETGFKLDGDFASYNMEL